MVSLSIFFSRNIDFFFFFEDIRKGSQILCLFYEEKKMREGRRPFYRRKNGKEKKIKN